jgi:hypothetical protein
MAKTIEHHRNDFQPALFVYEAEMSPIVPGSFTTAIEVLPQILEKLKHWDDKPNHIILMSDPIVAKSALVKESITGYEVSCWYETAIPKFGKPTAWGAGVLLLTERYDFDHVNDALKGFAKELKRGKNHNDHNPGAMIVIERVDHKPQQVELNRRKKILQNSGFSDAGFIRFHNKSDASDGTGFLIWDAKLHRIMPQPDMEKQLHIVYGILSSINKRYAPFGYHICNSDRISDDFLAGKNTWGKINQLKQGIGVILAKSCGCAYDMGREENSLCPEHESENQKIPRYQDEAPVSKSDTHKKSGKVIWVDTIDARPEVHPSQITDYPCRKCGEEDNHREMLESDAVIIGANNKGYEIEMTLKCDHHGLRARVRLIADGNNLSALKPDPEKIIEYELFS